MSRGSQWVGLCRIAVVVGCLCTTGCPADLPGYAPPTDTGPLDGQASPDVRLDAPPPIIDAAPPDALPPDLAPPDLEPPDLAPPPLDAAPPDQAIPDMFVPEPVDVCDGFDDDGDGRVDEDPGCGPYVESRCTLGMAWSDRLAGDITRADGYNNCAADGAFSAAFRQCRRSRGRGFFHTLQPPVATDSGDFLALRFACDDPADPARAAWFEGHCEVTLGHAAFDPGVVDVFGPCPGGVGELGEQWCLPSGEGRFRDARAPRIDAGEALAIRFACVDPAQPERAAAATASAQVLLGWSDDCPGTWAQCPGFEGPGGRTRCVDSGGDGRFHTVVTSSDFGPGGCIGFALRSR